MFPTDPRCPVRVLRGLRAVRGKRPRRWSPQKGFYLSIGWPGHVLVCSYKRRRGYSPVELCKVTDGRVTGSQEWPKLVTSMRRVKVGGGASGGPHTHLAPIESNILDKLPNLVAHCSLVKYEDGEARRPGWITLKTMGAAWVVQCKDPDACASLTATADTLDNALVLADMLLGAEEAPWENDPFLKRQAKNSK